MVALAQQLTFLPLSLLLLLPLHSLVRLIDTQIISMYIKICGETLYLGNTYHCWQCANYARDICSWGTDITSEMCSGAHISRGNIYHCNTGPMHIPEYCLIFSQFLPVIPKELV